MQPTFDLFQASRRDVIKLAGAGAGVVAFGPSIPPSVDNAVGMAEVSTCDVTVYVGQHVQKGEQTGMFHFGGSTHCLIFRPGVELEFDFGGQQPGLDAGRLPINSAIARVK